jgi:methylmalonyl-CoA/ethylmalonyl-CoA epimerase
VEPNSLIAHVGIAVSDFDEAVARYSLLTGDDTPVIEEVADQQVRVAMFSAGVEGGGNIELLAALSDDSPIAKFLAKRGEGLHHLSIQVADIRARLQQLKDAGIRLIDESPRTGAGSHLVAFVHPSGTGGVLLELVEIA